MLGFKRKSDDSGGRVARTAASLALTMGVLAGIGGAIIAGSAPASAGTTQSFNYGCSIIGTTYTFGATVSESPDLPSGTPQVGATYGETYSVTITIPGSLLDFGASADAGLITTGMDFDAAVLSVVPGGTGGFTQSTQTTDAVSAAVGSGPQVPLTTSPALVPVLASGNPSATVTFDMGSLNWTTAPGTGTGPWTSTLSAGNLVPTFLGASQTPTCTPTGSTLIDSMNTVSPPEKPVLASPQSATVSSGQATTINVLTGSSDVGDNINPASVDIVSPPSHGTATANPNGTVTYQNTSGDPATTDSFTVQVQNDTQSDPGTAAPNGGLSNIATVNIGISFNTCSSGNGNAGGGAVGTLSACSLHQLILLPVEPGNIQLSQNGGLPLDVLGSSICAPPGATPGIVLNGQEQLACGAMSPVTVTNATGLDTGWQVTGQTSDFLDPLDAVGTTCDTPGTYSSHCIPGDNLTWQPAAGVAHGIVPGDVAQITPGTPMAPIAATAPSVSNPLLGSVQPTTGGLVVEPAVTTGLADGPVVLCSTASLQAGGTFLCGASIELAVPASVAEPIVDSHLGEPAYEATLTLTLS